MPSDVELFIIGGLIAEALVIVLVIFMVRNMIRRYEQFRVEVIGVIGSILQNIDDINQRLIAAGYPPGQISLPGTTPWTQPVRPGQRS